jgi:sulfoxide reductase heme-binding subunit YedZ
MKYRGFEPGTAVLRWGLPAVAVGIVLGATAPTTIQLVAAAVASGGGSLSWYLERLTGFLAYLAITGSVVYGLLLSTKLLDAFAHRPVSFTLHQDLASFGLGLAGIHGALLGLDRTIHFSLTSLVVPFAAPYRPLWVGIGQVAFYVTLAVVLSFYARRRIGQRSWRLLHYATFVAFAGATIHGVMSGTDSTTAWAWWLYVGSSVVVTFLLAYRIAASVSARARRAAAASARPSIGLPFQVPEG